MATTLVGVLFLASGSSALNQLQEIPADAKMPRTAQRPLPSGRISVLGARLFVVVGLIVGLGLLWRIDYSLAALGVVAVVCYNGLYTLWWKKHWSYAAVPGAIPGALPILMGSVAAQGNLLAPSGIFLFFLLFFWQMPHFWVLALKYRADYASGDFPTLPVTHGTGVTVSRIITWCLAYVGIATLGPLFMNVRGIYCVTAFLMSMKLLWELRKFVKQPESKSWLHFFLWVNFSLIIYIAAAGVDLWSVYLIRYFTK
jgi:protoheme IX farnesyltransferase